MKEDRDIEREGSRGLMGGGECGRQALNIWGTDEDLVCMMFGKLKTKVTFDPRAATPTGPY